MGLTKEANKLDSVSNSALSWSKILKITAVLHRILTKSGANLILKRRSMFKRREKRLSKVSSKPINFRLALIINLTMNATALPISNLRNSLPHSCPLMLPKNKKLNASCTKLLIAQRAA